MARLVCGEPRVRHLLRALAIASNLAFIGYGYLDHLWPIVILHVAMLPMNVIRLRQVILALRAERVGLRGRSFRRSVRVLASIDDV
jgi:hypothetical protein